MPGLTGAGVETAESVSRRVEALANLAIGAAFVGVGAWRIANGRAQWSGMVFMFLLMGIPGLAGTLAEGRALWVRLGVPSLVFGLAAASFWWAEWPHGGFDIWTLVCGMGAALFLNSALRSYWQGRRS